MSYLLVIKPKNTFNLLADLREIWQFRELLYFLTWRDLKVRYKQTVVGVAWVLFQPFVSMVVFTVFFGTFANMPTDGAPYPIFVFLGLIFWQFFSTAVSDISGCLISNQGIVSKVYFPRMILPLSMIFTRFIDFLVATSILIFLMFYYHFVPNLSGFLVFPVLCLVTALAALGLGLWFASLNVKYRDVRYVIPFFIQMLMFVTPVVYSSSILGKYGWFLALNPLAGVIKTARSEFLHSFPTNWTQFSFSVTACLVVLVVGWLYFRTVEKNSVDTI
jgi:lipopolysaccharide transport system permease protein